MRKPRARSRILKKLPRAPGGNCAQEGACPRHEKTLVRRRGPHRPEEQDPPPLGQARHPSKRTAGPTDRFHLHLRCSLPEGGQGCSPDHAGLQHRGDELLNVYLIHVGWDPGLKHLIYEERERSSADAKHARNGSVHIPFGSPFMYLVCRDGGFVRLMLLSQPDDNGLARGLLCTLSNPRGAIFIPAATAVFLRRLQAKETPQIGLIKPEDASYEGYQETLSTVITEEFGAFIFPQGVVERRRELTIA